MLSRLGLHGAAAPLTSTTPYYTPHILILNFLIAYAGTSTRFVKQSLGLDHNVNPREDLSVHGPRAVEKGRITQAQLDALRRLEAAHANAVEHFPFFGVAVAMATLSGVDARSVNTLGAVYTVVRVAYAVAYYKITTPRASYFRSLLWWAGNFTCMRLVWVAGRAINAGRH